MKICFFNSAKVWGGGEKWHLDHALAFREEEHEVMVVSNRNSELLKRAANNGLRTKSFSIGNLSFLSPFKLFSLYLFFKKEKFDVLVMNFSKDLKPAAPMAKLAGIPKIVYRRGSDIAVKNTWLNRFLFGKCLTDVLANSEATKRSVLKSNPALFPPEKIKVIYNGIDVSTREKETKNENKIPVVGTLGRLVHQKGTDILLDIAAILKERHVKCKIKIGGAGVLAEELIRSAHDKNLGDFVEFAGFVDDPDRFMNRLDVFVLTSRWEGFGYVLAEAMLARKPVIAFDVSSNPELVFDDVSGFLIPFGNLEKFADAIQTLIEQPEKRTALGKAGFDIVHEKFDFEKNKRLVIKYLTIDS